MFFAALFACHVAPPSDTASASDTASGDTAPDELPVLERRLRASYEAEEGLNLPDGEVVVLGVNNETEPEAEHADLHVSLGRYIGLTTYDPDGDGRLCAAGVGLASIADVAAECDGAWMLWFQCAVNMTDAEPACAGDGYLVRPLSGDALYRMRVVTDDMVAEGDYLAGVTVEVQEVR